jgi:hypothetical protein
MGCGCGKKKQAPVLSPDAQNARNLINTVAHSGKDMISPSDWGPLFWKILHTIAEKIGGPYVPAGILGQHAWCIEFIINQLQYTLPCKECQTHYKNYLIENPITGLNKLSGSELRLKVRTWLWELHNVIRIRQGKMILVSTVDECTSLYSSGIEKWEYDLLYEYGKYGVKVGYITMDNWSRWIMQLTRVKNMLSL